MSSKSLRREVWRNIGVLVRRAPQLNTGLVAICELDPRGLEDGADGGYRVLGYWDLASALCSFDRRDRQARCLSDFRLRQACEMASGANLGC